MMDKSMPHLPLAFYEMAFDFLREVMQESGDPRTMGTRIAETYRELTGARTVLLFQNLQLFGGGSYRLVAGEPRRRRSQADAPHIMKTVQAVSAGKEVAEVDPLIIPCSGDVVSIGAPLLNPHGENVGVILLLNLPRDSRNMSVILESIKFLTGYISSVFNNALTHEFQENLIAEKTRALEDEVQRRKEIQKKTDQQRILLETTMNAIPGIICLKDGDGRWIMANDYTLALFNFSHADYRGKTSRELAVLNASHRDTFMNDAETDDKAWELKNVFRNEEFVVGPDGSLLDFDVVKIPLFKADERRHALVVAGRDITERTRLERELFQARKMEAIGTLAGGISHNFNNILSGIIGFAEIALMDVPRESDAANSIDEVLKASRRAADLVKQILAFSRKSDQHMAPLSPRKLIKESLKMLRASLPDTVEIQEEIHGDCGKIMVAPTGIHQIVINLCRNALHAMENEKGVLRVGLHLETLNSQQIKSETDVVPGTFAVLKISDTGHGIDPETMDRIFDPYFTTKTMEKGTGLGLAVVHGIVKECHGFIRVESEPGHGTTFSVYLPVLTMDAVTAPVDPIEASPPVAGRRILLVDDDPAIVKLNRAVLELLGYQVTATTQSVYALNRFSRDPDGFDLLITDQTMPGMNGLDLATKILKIRPDLPIILCSSYSAILSEADTLAVGIKKYLEKPVSRKTFSLALQEVLARPGKNNKV